ncbi:IL11 protein, partial [Chaetorhynchus papuensis]|nr:IL11 protein [Chaetorhynchus papuensis]
PRPRPPPADTRGDLDSVIHLAKALLGDTKAFLGGVKSRFPAEGEHKLDSLPVLAMSALELPNIQASALGGRLGSDLLRYQRLLEWLRGGGGALRGLEPDLGALRSGGERLRGRLEHLMSRLSLPRPAAPRGGAVPVSPPPVSPWGAVRGGDAVTRGLHLYLDWAARGLVLLRNRL